MDNEEEEEEEEEKEEEMSRMGGWQKRCRNKGRGRRWLMVKGELVISPSPRGSLVIKKKCG